MYDCSRAVKGSVKFKKMWMTMSVLGDRAHWKTTKMLKLKTVTKRCYKEVLFQSQRTSQEEKTEFVDEWLNFASRQRPSCFRETVVSEKMHRSGYLSTSLIHQIRLHATSFCSVKWKTRWRGLIFNWSSRQRRKWQSYWRLWQKISYSSASINAK